MPVRLINVTDYRETLGRRRDLKFGQFDQVTRIFTGPVARKDVWVPQMGSPLSPDYPLMLATASSDIEQDGALGTLTVTYQGRMYINGFQPTPKLSISRTETSASVQVAASQVVNIGKSQVVGYEVDGVWVSVEAMNTALLGARGVSEPTGTTVVPFYGNVGRIVRYGWATLTINYISTSVSAKYQTLSRPTGPKGYNQGAAYEIISTIIGEVSGTELTYGASGAPTLGPVIINLNAPDRSTLKPPVPLLLCTAFTADQVAGSQYDCAETWEYKWVDSSHIA